MQAVSAGGQRTVNGRGPREAKGMQRPHMEGNWRERDSGNLAAQNRAARGAGHGPVSGTKSPQTASQAQQRESHTTPNVEVAMSDHPFRFLCCLIGHVVRVETRDAHVFEGVFHALSQKMVLALTYVHDRCQDDRNDKLAREQSETAPGDARVSSNLCEGVPHADDLVELLMIDWSNVVKVEKSGVELTDFLGLSASGGAPLTDSEIASATMAPQFGGQRSEKQLVPFFADADGDLEIEAAPASLDDATGWSADDMFRENEKKFNATTDYDERFYTTALPHADTPEFRARDERARRLADSINRTTSARALDAENDEKADEEMHYSAVHRVQERRPAQTPNSRRDRTATATPPRGTQPPARPSPAPAPASTEPTPPAAAAPPAPAQPAANTGTSAASTQGTTTAPAASAPTTTSTNNTTAASAQPSSSTASRSSFNPNAPAFVFNPNARTFAPTSGPTQSSAPSASSSNESAPQYATAPHSTSAASAPQPPPNASRASSFSAAATPAAPAAGVPQPAETVSATSVASAPTVNAPAFANPPVAQPPVAGNMPQSRPGTAQAIPVSQMPFYPGNTFPQAPPFPANLPGQAQPHHAWIPQSTAHANAVWMPQAQPNAAQPAWAGPQGPGGWVVTDMQQAPPDAAARNNPQYTPHGAAPANTYAMPPGSVPQAASGAARDTPLTMQQQSFAPSPLQQQPVPQAQVNNAAQQPAAFPQQVQQVGAVPFTGQQQPGAAPYFIPAQSPPNAQTAAGVTQLAVNPYQQPIVGTMTGIYQPAGTMMPMAAQSAPYVVMQDSVQQQPPPPPPQDSQMAMQQTSVMVGGSRGGPMFYMTGQQPYNVAPIVDHGASAQQVTGPAPTHQLQPAQHPPAQPNAAHVPQPHGPAPTGPDSHNTGSKRRPAKQSNSNYRAGAPNAPQNTPYANQQQTAPTSGSTSLNSSAGATVLAAGTSAAGRNAGPSRQRNAADPANAADQPPGRDTPPQAANMNPAGVAYQQAAALNRPGSAGPFQRPVLQNVQLHNAAPLSISQQQQITNGMMVQHYLQPTAPNALQSGVTFQSFVPGHMDMTQTYPVTYSLPLSMPMGVPLPPYLIRAQAPNAANATVHQQVRLNSTN